MIDESSDGVEEGEGVDYLSSCPSLFSVISYLEPDKVLELKFVSRSFNSMFAQNRFLIPRNQASLDIFTVDDSSTSQRRMRHMPEILNIKLKVNNRHSYFGITGNRIRFAGVACRPIKQFYALNGIPRIFTAWSPDNRIISSIRNVFPLKDDGQLDYGIDNVEEGLRTLLSLIFDRYHFTDICVDDNVPEGMPVEWYQCIVEQFLKSQAKCKRLHVKRWRGANSLFDNIDCERFQIDNVEDLGSLVEEVNNWDRQFNLNVPLMTDVSAQPLKELVLKWRSTTMRIKSFSVYFPAAGHRHLFYGQQIVNLVEALEDVPFYKSKNAHNMYHCPTGFEAHKEMLIKRSDDICLSLAYSAHHCIHLHDFVYIGREQVNNHSFYFEPKEKCVDPMDFDAI